jgi:Leucine-rich repeat (LRR) protein
LDLSANLTIGYLDCSGNQFPSLDVSSNTLLGSLRCSDNQLTTLDISNNTAVTWLDCRGNNLTTLDVSANTELVYLWCGGNQLTTLDISSNLAIGSEDSYAECYLDIAEMPTLEEVCVWALPFPPDNFRLCMEGSPNVQFTTGCSR